MPLVGKRQALRAVFLLTTFGVLLSGCSLPWQRSDAPEPIVVPQLPPTPAPAPAPVRTVDDTAVEPPPQVVIDEQVGTVSAVGDGVKSEPGIAARMFSSLARENINIDLISTSNLMITCVVRRNELESAVRAVHREFME